MGLFDKKYCSVCGGKAGGWLSRCDLAGDKEYLCEECQAKCSPDLIEEGTSNWTPAQIKEHIAYMEMCEKVYNDEFEPDSGLSVRVMDDEELISVDSRHGWWAVNNSDDYGLFRFEDIDEVEFHESSTSLDEDEFGGNRPGIMEMRKIRDAMGDDAPVIPPSDKIDKIYIKVGLKNHPWLKATRVYLIENDRAPKAAVRDAFYDSIEVMRFFRYNAGAKSDRIEDYA